MSQANGDSPAIGGLFEGLSFFLVQRLPSRSNFVDKIKANGGRVVKLEQQADYVIADHVRKDCPPGSISYTLIDSAIRNGAVPDPEDHRAGPPVGSIRDVASSVPGKQTRRAFTAEDDRILWQWVQKAEEQGGSVKGNDIYKHLEAHNPRHTFQAWRDRYIKKLMGNPPAGCARSSASPAASKAEDGQRSASEEQGRAGATEEQRGTPDDSLESENNALQRNKFKLPRSSQQASSKPAPSQSPEKQGVSAPEFDETDFEALMGEAEDIYRLHKSQVRDAWKAWADAFPKHSAKRWRKFWEDQVKPEYLRRLEAEENGESSSDAEQVTETTSLKRKRSAEEQTSVEPPKAKIRPPASPKNGADDFSNRERRNSSHSRHARETQQLPMASLRPISIASTEEDQEDATPRQNGASGGQPMKIEVAQQSDLLTSEANRAAEQQLQLENDPKSAETSDTRRKGGDKDLVAEPSHHDGNGIQEDAHGPEAYDDFRAGPQPLQGNMSAQSPSIDQETHAGLHARISMRGNGFGQHDDEAEVDGSDSGSQSLDSQVAQDEDVVISDHLVEDGEVEDGLRSNEMIDPDLTGDPLTEANLASQHSLQKGQQLRGVDLPEDEQDQDQTDFATYLQNLVPQGQSAQEQADDGEESGLATLKGAQGKDQGNSAECLQDLFKEGKAPEHWANGTILKPADRSSLPQEDREMIDQTTYTHNETVPEDLPLSSQQEIDDVIEANSHWPSSPDATQRDEPPHTTSQNLSMAFETQIQQPRLPSEEPEAEGQANEDMFMTQPPLAEGAHGSLPRSSAMRARDEINTGLYFSSPVKEKGRPDDFRDRIDRGETPETQDEDGEEGQGSREGYIDLSIAEPDGDFDLSSPSKSAAAERQESIKGQHAPVANADGKHASTGFAEDGTVENGLDSSRHALKVEAEDEEDDMEMEQELPAALGQETIEVSSTSSSSSSPQDAEEERDVDSQVASTRKSRHDAPDTQEILDAETQKPDFDMPLPPDSQEDDAEPDMEDDLPEDPLDFQPNQRPSHASQQQLRQSEPDIRGTTPRSTRRLEKQPPTEARGPLPPTSQPPPRRRTPRPIPPSSSSTSAQPLATDTEIETFLTTMQVRYACGDSSAIAALKHTSMRPDLAELVVLEGKAGRGLPEDLPGVWSEAEDRALEGGDARLLRRVEAKHGWEEVMARLEFLGEWRAVG
ncbi:hypothetical protein D0860_08463 [Hortaea werneckii]|uniref:Telomeric repeat-binding factor 2-interacting protein 1 n=2 Tax=Hortaea werneckii TaxID=91943 RepID=A0A3M7IBG2_HORWE|nr:hypothetical protein D0860_08463 [Hortaea werneckii]RMZ22910.1 hypothetical protein D0859_13057 [Hortaea werneckii]